MRGWTFFKRAAANVVRRKKPQAPPQRELESDFAAYKIAHPDATHAEFYAAHAMSRLRAGKAHSTLGLRLYDKNQNSLPDSDYLDAGRERAKQYRKLLGIHRTSKMIDYGCGSLRLGIHFIKYLQPEHYMGLDVTRDFIDIGVSAVPDLVAEKKPQVYAIDAASLRIASEFGADFVVSNAVSYHVHPDELGAYLANLAMICVKPGARLIFDAKCSSTPLQFRNRGWAYPLESYIGGLKPLKFVGKHRYGSLKEPRAENAEIEFGMLEFRRD